MLADSVVATQSLPVPTGTADGYLHDPTVVGLLDFAGYMIKWALDTRMAQLHGPTNGAVIADACPTANRYPYNPETTHVRLPKPALFMWWDGPSRVTQWTTIYARRERQIKALYMFAETVLPAGMKARNGIPAVVDAVFAKIANERRHPLYGYDGAPAGTTILQSLDLMHILYDGGVQGMMFEVPGNTTVADQGKTGGQVQRGYPALTGTFTVWERVGVSTMEDPGDVAGDVLASLETNEQGDVDDTLPFREAYLPGADGSETL